MTSKPRYQQRNPSRRGHQEPASRGDDRPAARQRILSLSTDAARVLADLHAADWTHGDLQPDHLVYESAATHMIDFACAQGPADVPAYADDRPFPHPALEEVINACLEAGPANRPTAKELPRQLIERALPGLGLQVAGLIGVIAAIWWSRSLRRYLMTISLIPAESSLDRASALSPLTAEFPGCCRVMNGGC